mmetsp:Transcript_114802/g.325173  ORF Transcript_114802/g.325173 Transcript_114802/m.325173 type:complete len:217 (+) Transcript_114802:349-999(+)
MLVAGAYEGRIVTFCRIQKVQPADALDVCWLAVAHGFTVAHRDDEPRARGGGAVAPRWRPALQAGVGRVPDGPQHHVALGVRDVEGLRRRPMQRDDELALAAPGHHQRRAEVPALRCLLVRAPLRGDRYRAGGRSRHHAGGSCFCFVRARVPRLPDGVGSFDGMGCMQGQSRRLCSLSRASDMLGVPQENHRRAVDAEEHQEDERRRHERVQHVGV